MVPNGSEPNGDSPVCHVTSDVPPNESATLCSAVVAFDHGVRETDGDDRLDITSIIRECASLLTVKEPFVCNTESFSLHDSMAATELTDRTMDCCEIPASYYSGKESKDGDEASGKFLFPRPPPHGLDDPFAMLPWEHLSHRDVSFVAMKMLGCLQAVLSGSSVGESTFTCLYAHSSALQDMQRRLFGESAAGFDAFESSTLNVTNAHPTVTLQFALFVCAVALVDATDMVRTVVVNADIYEEEDFSPNTYDIPFYSEALDIPTLQWIDEARRLLAESPSQDVDPNFGKLMDAIFEFFHCFLSVGSALSKLAAAALPTEVERTQLLCREAVQTLDAIDEILSSVAFEDDDELQKLHRRIFDMYVNRPLVGNTPVRKPVSRSDRDTTHAFRKIMHELDWAVCDLLLRGGTLARVQRMLDRVQRSEVNVLGRSLIVLNLFFDEKLLGQHALDALISDDLRRWRDLPDSFADFGLTRAFIERLAKPIYDALKLRALNRCRQRNYIEVVMLNDWISLQSEAHMIDIHYREHVKAPKGSFAPFLTQYVLYYMLSIMDRHLAVGLELQIYRSHLDVCMAYWYRDFLLSALLNNLSTMRASKSAIVTNSKGGSVVDEGALDVTRRRQEDDFEMMLISVQRDVCRGLKRFLVALQQAGILHVPPYRFTTQERIFNDRFAAFSLIQHPPPLSYSDYAQGCDYTQVDAHDLHATTSTCFVNAKAAVDHLLKEVRKLDVAYAPLQEAELRALLKVCVGNNVYLLKLKSVAAAASSAASATHATLSFEPMAPFCTVKLS